uniref:ERF1 domain-containing protein n=1 Tax=Romanomermis culicivorax TaxID=13658 RepID=A0A915J3R7_ROMCU
MRLVNKQFDKDGCGHVTLIPEDAEDMWHCYNLIQEGDLLRSSTIRKVTTESSTGSTTSQRVHTVLKIAVESVNYDTHSGTLHVKGRNTEENPHVKMGAYHTLDLELNRKFTLNKTCWDSIYIERVDMACDPGLNRFFDNIIQAIVRHIDFDIVKCVLIASPGFLKEQFFDYLMQQASKDGNKILLDNRPKFLLVHSSSGFKHALKEVLADPQVASKLSDTKASNEVKTLETFFETLQNEPGRAYYGFAHVNRAKEAQAIESLLVTDSLFRSKDLDQRKKYVNLVEEVKEQGGLVKLFSSLHVSGEQLQQLCGVAAILRFPMPEIEEELELEDDENEETEDVGRTDNNNVDHAA